MILLINLRALPAISSDAIAHPFRVGVRVNTQRRSFHLPFDVWPTEALCNATVIAPTGMKANDLTSLVKQKIENLRPKLLDLSRRNPLIATKLGPRSTSHLRVVDELPDILFYKLNNGPELPLVPLPAIDDDPRDENTSTFRDALINARLTNEEYLAAMESVDRDSDDYIDRTRQIERVLKDKVREALGLPQRAKKNEVNLVHHAKINGITPSYELPTPDAEHADGRHNDGNIQTLLLPNDLERKL